MNLWSHSKIYWPLVNLPRGIAIAANPQWTDLRIQGEFQQMHSASSMNGQPLWITHMAVWCNSQKFVWHSNLVHFWFFAIDKKTVGLPNGVQRLPIHWKKIDFCVIKRKTFVSPRLSEVAINEKVLLLLIYWTLETIYNKKTVINILGGSMLWQYGLWSF